MKKKHQQSMLPLAAAAMVFGTAACTITSPENKILGEWHLDKVDGNLGDTFSDISNIEVHFEFLPDGDFEFGLLDSDEDYKVCYLGEWEYEKDNKEIKIEFEEIEMELTLDNISRDEISGDMLFNEDGDDLEGAFELVRVH
jgi:hypothetical protein